MNDGFSTALLGTEVVVEVVVVQLYNLHAIVLQILFFIVFGTEVVVEVVVVQV